jgi:uncharacterized protein (DUF362 family)
LLSIIRNPQIKYPDGADYFSPDTHYPEYALGHLSSRPNPVYDAVRRIFAQSGLDRANYGASSWNPLAEFIKPGQQVFVLCNFVYHRRAVESLADFWAKCTHASILRAVADYILLAAGPEGRILFGNAPVQSCRWTSVLSDTGADRVAEFYSRRELPVKARDLRMHIAEHDRFARTSRIERGNERNAILVDMGTESLLSELDHPKAKFRVTDYDPRRIESFHRNNQHVYSLNRIVLDSDIIFSIPKLKTHEKVGITCAVKGCVGSVAHKDCLAHHRFGPPNRGGDEYPSDSFGMKRGMSHLHDLIQRVPLDRRLGRMLRYSERLMRWVVRQTASPVAGSWSGNDTCWRMAVDLARILAYADREGVLSRDPQRKHLALVDGIVGGEGQGPLNPDPIASGTLVFGDDIVSVDHAAAILMGFDPEALPIVWRSAGGKGKCLLPSSARRDEPVILNGESIDSDTLKGTVTRSYRPPRGWEGVMRV